MADNRRGLAIVFLTVVIDLLGFGIVLPLLARYAERLNAGGLTIGMLTASFSAMQFLFAPFWGRLSDRIGRRPVIIIGLLGSVISYALFARGSSVESLALLFVGRIGAGIFGATISTAQAYVADCTPPEKRTGGMAMIGAAFGIGFTIGPLICILSLSLDPQVDRGRATKEALAKKLPADGQEAKPPAAAHLGLSPMPGIVASVFSGIALCLAIFMLPESLQPGVSGASHKRGYFDGISYVLSLPSVGWLILIGFINIFGFGQFESTLNRLTERGFGMSDIANNGVFAWIGFTLILAQGVVVRRLSKKVADRTTLVMGTATMMLGLIGLCIVVNLQSVVGLWIILPVIVLGFAMMNTSTQSLISKSAPPEKQGIVLGVNQSGSAMARILAPLIGNAVFDRGIMIPYVLGASLVCCAFIAALRLNFRRSGEQVGT